MVIKEYQHLIKLPHLHVERMHLNYMKAKCYIYCLELFIPKISYNTSVGIFTPKIAYNTLVAIFTPKIIYIKKKRKIFVLTYK